MAGSKRPIKTAMIAMTTSSSISVKARLRGNRRLRIGSPFMRRTKTSDPSRLRQPLHLHRSLTLERSSGEHRAIRRPGAGRSVGETADLGSVVCFEPTRRSGREQAKSRLFVAPRAPEAHGQPSVGLRLE